MISKKREKHLTVHQATDVIKMTWLKPKKQHVLPNRSRRIFKAFLLLLMLGGAIQAGRLGYSVYKTHKKF